MVPATCTLPIPLQLPQMNLHDSKSIRDSCIPYPWRHWVLQLKKFSVQAETCLNKNIP